MNSATHKPDHYVGEDADLNGGMTAIGRMVRDARVFGLIDQSETCAGWNLCRIDGLLQQVNAEWDKYGCLVSQLPDGVYVRYREIHDTAVTRARLAGWCGELEVEGEH